MQRILTALFVFVTVCVARAGLIITMENDFFIGTDDNFSHGTEMEWVSDQGLDADGPFRVGWGVNQCMYTPMDFTPLPPLLDQHPWVGTLSLFRETWSRSKFYNEEVRTRYEVGVLGPASGNKWSQTTVHRITNNKTPHGWDNQFPNEPMCNVYHDRFHLLWEGRADKWSTDLKGVYGGTLGTTFINVKGGAQVRSGYNIPSNSMPGGIEPKMGRDGNLVAVESGFFMYLTAGAEEMVVLHNATCGSSFFRERDLGAERDLELFVGMYRYGVVVGHGEISLTYLIGHRSNEFEGQEDGGMGWGMLRVEWLHQF